jgi:hypothetical protein
LQLSVISAPVIGGPFELNVKGPDKDGPARCARGERRSGSEDSQGGPSLLLGVQRPVAGVRAMQVGRLEVESEHLGLALAGEPNGNLPGQFEVVARALRVIAPRQ